MKKVQILLSIYNGEKYLEEQLQSILNQDYSDISILIRDDGSKDNSINIIKKYASMHKGISYYLGENLGVRNSFFDLICKADPTMDYYSFSDQDDFWKPDKISSAIKLLENEASMPLLYCGRTTLVNEKLEYMETTIPEPHIVPGFGNALVENICSGCTCVCNKDLLSLVKRGIPEFTVMHDWWLYLCASAFGKVIYDRKSYILYRQHDDNIIGSRANHIEEFKMRIKNYNKNRGQLIKQAREFSRLYQLDSENRELIELLISTEKNITKRISIQFNSKIYRQRLLDNTIFRFLFLTGRM